VDKAGSGRGGDRDGRVGGWDHPWTILRLRPHRRPDRPPPGPAGGGGVHAEGSAVHVRGTLGTAWTSPASTPWWWWWWS